MSLKGKHVLRIKDLSTSDVKDLVESAAKLDKKTLPVCKGKHAVCFFSKSSTRTKSAWEVGCSQLGLSNSFNDAASSQLGKKESIRDSAKVFSEWYDVMGWRCFNYEDILEFSKNASFPCINLLCNKNHPTQAIADLLTIKNAKGKIKGIKVAFVGACNNNVARSLIEGLLMLGGSYIGIGPKSIHPDNEELKFYQSLTKKGGGTIEFTEDVHKVKGVDVIYQDVFLDLGESQDLWPSRLQMYKGYQVNGELVKLAKKDYIYMHCLPALNGSKNEYTEYVKKTFGTKFPFVKNGEIEVTNDVFMSKNSVVFKQAHNRLPAMKAIIKAVLGK